MKRHKLEKFVARMDALKIDVKLVANYPWIYIDSINGERVTEKFYGNHGFTIAFIPVKKDQELQFTDLKEIFKLIRKYTGRTK